MAEVRTVRIGRRLGWGIASGAVLLACAVGVFAMRAGHSLELMALAADGMVLERNTTVSLTGRARAGWPVVLVGTWGGITVTRADDDGAWRATLRTGGAGGPYRMLVWAGDARVVRDVWLGETWLCSGQSNMAITIAENDPRVMIDPPASPPIQLFTVPLAVADTPQTGCGGAWHTATRETARDFSAVCWHFGRALHAVLGVPIGLVASAAGGVDIFGWTSQRALASFPDDRLSYENESVEPEPVSTIAGRRPSLIFNAMIAPLAPYTFRGIAWYQGEADVGHAERYGRLFPAMIRDWRAWFERELPFGFVQLPGFGGYRPRGAITELREAQRRTLAVPDTDMVVSIDLGDGHDIHAASKPAIALRLASWALGQLYGRTDMVVSGPLYRGVRLMPWGLEVEFDHADGGLVATAKPIVGFELAGEDHAYHHAWAVVSSDRIIVRSPRVPKPIAVRYAWDDIPVSAITNLAGLPASPFRSDDAPTSTTSTEPQLSAR
jgi:sialate O-acetylesterase